MTSTMRAVLIKDGKGPIENLYIGERQRPQPTEKGQILVKVKMFGLNRMDVHQREGQYPLPPNTTDILGVEFSGTVEATAPGDETDKFNKGDEVFGIAIGGAYAEYILVSSHALVLPKPTHLTWSEAAGIPENWLTAFQALFKLANFQEGESVLIHAGASGVGVAANQLARYFGAKHVITTASSAEKLGFLSKMPYAPTDTVNYKTEDFSKRVLEITEGRGVDVVIDFIGKDYWDKNIASLAVDGRMVHLGMMSGADVPTFSLAPILRKRLSILGSTLRARSLEYQSDLMQRFNRGCMEEMRGQHEDESLGGLRVFVHKVFPWTEIQDAHREMESNKNSGKIIVEIV